MRGEEKTIWIGEGQSQFKPTGTGALRLESGDYEIDYRIEVGDESSWFVILSRGEISLSASILHFISQQWVFRAALSDGPHSVRQRFFRLFVSLSLPLLRSV
jgi:hypothetical protein